MLDWFERLFGFRENFKTVREDLKCEEEEGLTYLTGPNNVRYCAGRFEHVSVGELTTRPTVHSGPTTLGVVSGDVTKLIADPANNGAVFQVASQFNCLEFISGAVTPEAGVTNYERDHTQGPACSIACGPGTVYRNYYVPMGEGRVGQTAGCQLDGMDGVVGELERLSGERVGRYVRVKNREDLDAFISMYARIDSNNYEGIWQKLKIGIHHETQVTSTGFGKNLTKSPEQRITQVFGSAAAIGYSYCGKSDLWRALAGGILDHSYEGLFHAAAANPASDKLYLTFIGGGVFQNPIHWICEAILRAARKYKDAGLEVYVVSYHGPCPQTLKLINDFKKL